MCSDEFEYPGAQKICVGWRYRLKSHHYLCDLWSGETGHPCLLHDLRGNVFSFSPLGMMFAVGLSYMAFIMLR